MWFKSDISVYDREDFQVAWQECDCLSTVWEWIQRESIKAQGDTIRIKNSLYLKGILKKLHISEAQFRDAQRLLGEMELIVFDDPNIITLPDWLLKQGSYFAEKQRNASKMADWRERKKIKKENDVTVTYQLRDSNVTECYSKEQEQDKEKIQAARARSHINLIPIKSNTLSAQEVYFELKKLGYPATSSTDEIAESFVAEMEERKWCDAKGNKINDVVKYLRAKFGSVKQHA